MLLHMISSYWIQPGCANVSSVIGRRSAINDTTQRYRSYTVEGDDGGVMGDPWDDPTFFIGCEGGPFCQGA